MSAFDPYTDYGLNQQYRRPGHHSFPVFGPRTQYPQGPLPRSPRDPPIRPTVYLDPQYNFPLNPRAPSSVHARGPPAVPPQPYIERHWNPQGLGARQPQHRPLRPQPPTHIPAQPQPQLQPQPYPRQVHPQFRNIHPGLRGHDVAYEGRLDNTGWTQHQHQQQHHPQQHHPQQHHPQQHHPQQRHPQQQHHAQDHHEYQQSQRSENRRSRGHSRRGRTRVRDTEDMQRPPRREQAFPLLDEVLRRVNELQQENAIRREAEERIRALLEERQVRDQQQEWGQAQREDARIRQERELQDLRESMQSIWDRQLEDERQRQIEREAREARETREVEDREREAREQRRQDEQVQAQMQEQRRDRDLHMAAVPNQFGLRLGQGQLTQPLHEYSMVGSRTSMHPTTLAELILEVLETAKMGQGYSYPFPAPTSTSVSRSSVPGHTRHRGARNSYPSPEDSNSPESADQELEGDEEYSRHSHAQDSTRRARKRAPSTKSRHTGTSRLSGSVPAEAHRGHPSHVPRGRSRRDVPEAGPSNAPLQAQGEIISEDSADSARESDGDDDGDEVEFRGARPPMNPEEEAEDRRRKSDLDQVDARAHMKAREKRAVTFSSQGEPSSSRGRHSESRHSEGYTSGTR